MESRPCDWLLYAAGGLTGPRAAPRIWSGIASGLAERLSTGGVLIHLASPGLRAA